MSQSGYGKPLDEKTAEAATLAATVILLRDGEAGLETLMLRRNSKIAFGGMSVFPGGRLDPGDWEGLAQDDEIGTVRAPMVLHPDRPEAEREQQTEHPGVARKYCSLDAAKAL